MEIGFVDVKSGPLILAGPNAAHLHDRTELRSLKLVKVVIELVGTLDELGLVRFNGQLHLNYH